MAGTQKKPPCLTWIPWPSDMPTLGIEPVMQWCKSSDPPNEPAGQPASTFVYFQLSGIR